MYINNRHRLFKPIVVKKRALLNKGQNVQGCDTTKAEQRFKCREHT